MELEEVKRKISKLSESLHHYNYMYYVKSESLVSDYEFDMLLKELEALESKNKIPQNSLSVMGKHAELDKHHINEW